MDDLIFNKPDLNPYLPFRQDGTEHCFTDCLKALHTQQLDAWPLFSENHKSLGSIRTKTISVSGFNVTIQFNPARIKSTAAKVDSASITQRPCFLCRKNLPVEQRGFAFNDNYVFLCNPYPVFEEHYTIPNIRHIPQNIGAEFGQLIDLSKTVRNELAVFYNGPECGASAPDHLHFQAVPQNSLPLINRLRENDSIREALKKNPDGITLVNQHPLRFFILFDREQRKVVCRMGWVLQKFNSKSDKDESTFNLILYSVDNTYNLIIFPLREQHRPKEYYYDGDKGFLVSPASIDLAGVIILPRETDYKRIDAQTIESIYDQVILDEAKIEKLIN